MLSKMNVAQQLKVTSLLAENHSLECTTTNLCQPNSNLLSNFLVIFIQNMLCNVLVEMLLSIHWIMFEQCH